MRKFYAAAVTAVLLAMTGCSAGGPAGADPSPAGYASPAAHDRAASPRVVVSDGLWLAGSEMEPGVWAAYPATVSCVWVVRADDTPEGFVSGGRAVDQPTLARAVYAGVAAGQLFETAACGTWIRVGDR